MFDALEVSLEMIRELRGSLSEIRTRDRDLYLQMRRAAASIALNLAEGRARAGKDRIHHWRIARGCAEELLAALRVAEAFGDIDLTSNSPALALLNRVLAMLYRLTV